MVLSRTFLFFHLARCKGKIQADGARAAVGFIATCAYGCNFQFHPWPGLEATIGWYRLPSIRFFWAGLLECLFIQRCECGKQHGEQCPGDS